MKGMLALEVAWAEWQVEPDPYFFKSIPDYEVATQCVYVGQVHDSVDFCT